MVMMRCSPRPQASRAGAWYAWPSTHIGHELIAAGMMILAGGGRGLPLDYDELERWTRVGFERGRDQGMGSDDAHWLIILVSALVELWQESVWSTRADR